MERGREMITATNPSIEQIESQIHLMRGVKVMIDRDLAKLYGVTTGALNQAVKRNKQRFPDDFMFQLSENDCLNLISQTVISSAAHGGVRHLPFVFTELGIAMLSSVLHSEQAIAVNIQIMRTFTKLRALIANNQELQLKLEFMEKQYDEQFKIVFHTIRKLMQEEETRTPEIGFNTT
ncbi:MAG: ORF6N domain-containing protein [Candidatus Uhrbacteria bacterium]